MEKANKEAFVFAFTYPDEETIRKNGGRALPTNREAAAEALKNWMKARYQVEALPWGLTVDWQEIAIRNYHAEDFGRKRASTIVTF